jgi:uncharacterized spore protein YtfJ
MEEVQDLVKVSLGEIEKILSTKSVVGEPMTVEGNTLIPLVSMGFVFGAGGGSGKGRKEQGEGMGGGTGGGGGIRPVGVIVINKEGVRIEPMRGAVASIGERVADIVAKVMEKRGEKKQEQRKEE